MTVCDIGNSTFHFFYGNTEFKINIKNTLKKVKIKKPLYFISVNKQATKKLLKQFPDAINLKSKFKLKTKYANTIGIDRVVACSYIKSAIVVDFGSAITIDVIKNSKHKGGFILPGLDAIKNIYPKISHKLIFNFENCINLDKMPKNTNMAINYAIVNMIILPIKEIQTKYNLKIIFTGENSKLFLYYFRNYRFEEKLIFKNMIKAIQEIK